MNWVCTYRYDEARRSASYPYGRRCARGALPLKMVSGTQTVPKFREIRPLESTPLVLWKKIPNGVFGTFDVICMCSILMGTIPCGELRKAEMDCFKIEYR